MKSAGAKQLQAAPDEQAACRSRGTVACGYISALQHLQAYVYALRLHLRQATKAAHLQAFPMRHHWDSPVGSFAEHLRGTWAWH